MIDERIIYTSYRDYERRGKKRKKNAKLAEESHFIVKTHESMIYAAS